MDSLDPWIGARLGGRYRIERALGQGGAGAVYQAEQEGLGRKVAIKLMRPELAADVVQLERFRREARAAAQLGHPHIVQLYDFAEATHGEPAYLVLELVAGRSLYQLLRAEAPLAPARAVALGVQILAALAAAHHAGIVHRDMKPGNVVVSELVGVGETAKVLDFGIAQMQASAAYQKLTQTGAIIGTPRYMSPEQALGKPIDARTDLWAVAVILYAALTGRFPFEGTPADVVMAIVGAPVPPMNRHDVSPELERAVLQALEKVPDDRHPSATAMAEALRAGLRAAAAPIARTAEQPLHRSTLSSEPATVHATLERPSPRTAPHMSATTFRVEEHQTLTPTMTGASTAPERLGEPTARNHRPRVRTSLRWLAASVALVAPLFLALGVYAAWQWTPRARLGVPPAVPFSPSGVGAVMNASSSTFIDDARRRASEIEPSARLVSIGNNAMSPTTGGCTDHETSGFSFVFVADSGRRFYVIYQGCGAALVDDFVAPVATAPLTGEPPDSATVMSAAAEACPSLLTRPSVMLTVYHGTDGLDYVMVNEGAVVWTGHVAMDGRIEPSPYNRCN